MFKIKLKIAMRSFCNFSVTEAVFLWTSVLLELSFGPSYLKRDNIHHKIFVEI
jgi:hypothetical protein